MDLTSADARTTIARLLQVQAGWCERLGSPLYATLLQRAADDATEGGPAFDLLRGHEDDPPGSALALRFMGAVHRLVLEGAAPTLAAFYPSAAGRAVQGDAWPAFRATLVDHVDELRAHVEHPVQTNEVGRSAALLGGFLICARESGMPLRILEIGSSAGLNLRWDRYRYESGGWSWGEASSSLVFKDVFEDAVPDTSPAIVVERAGCDPNPVDPMTAAGRITLMSYTWPDQTIRFRQLRDALRVALAVPTTVERADGPEWLSARLAAQAPGVATVAFHSIVAQYLGDDGRARLRTAVDDAGSRATPDAPVAWLRLEPSSPDGGGRFLVHLTTWPGGEERLLAESHPHGPPVRWLA